MTISHRHPFAGLLMASLAVAALALLAPVRAASPTLLVLNKGNLTMVTVDPIQARPWPSPFLPSEGFPAWKGRPSSPCIRT